MHPDDLADSPDSCLTLVKSAIVGELGAYHISYVESTTTMTHELVSFEGDSD